MTRHAVLKCAAAVLLLAGCAGPMGQLHPDLSLQSYSGGRFDGSYTGTIQLTSFAPEFKGMCWDGGSFAVTVQGAAFRYVLSQPNIPGRPNLTFTPHFSEKGVFSDQGTAGEATMSGRVTDKQMKGMIDGVNCVYTIEANRT